ncbi:acyl-coenzyme A thioesterase 8-like [Antedon mediterranea]|uniref:acyl-coenzyme A thioesterase 8-like n=1 Tax=Antedon mediterranea TaxID=105859 RepID=UPI003AF58956
MDVPVSARPRSYVNEESQGGSYLVNCILNLEKIEENIYRAHHSWKSSNLQRVYGGQVVGQAQVAAGNTVDSNLSVHSLHCYFLRAGDRNKPIVYKVENLRDGQSYATRLVQAVQNGKSIFTMIISFHRQEVSHFQHQCQMPDVPLPSNLLSDEQLLHKLEATPGVPQAVKDRVRSHFENAITMEYRRVDPVSLVKPTDKTSKIVLWVRAIGDIGDDMNMHRCVAAYMSDNYLATTCVYASNIKIKVGMLTSLDHTIWFHAPFRADDWLLFDFDSHWSGNGRGMATGKIWTEDGRLVMTVSQEVVLRHKL